MTSLLRFEERRSHAYARYAVERVFQDCILGARYGVSFWHSRLSVQLLIVPGMVSDRTPVVTVPAGTPRAPGRSGPQVATDLLSRTAHSLCSIWTSFCDT